MKRRDFIKYGGATIPMSPFMLNKTIVNTFIPNEMTNCYGVADRIMVIIQLDGGNDGLNTLIPTEQYDDYANLRPKLKIPQSSCIDLDSTLPLDAQVGLHPVMTGIKQLYDAGKAHIINGVGYPDSNLSHFKSTDLWNTSGDGTSANFNFDTGWMGRFLDSAYPGVAGNPSGDFLDPLGIQLGSRRPSLGFHTNNVNTIAINLAGQDPSGYYSVVNEVGGAAISNVPSTEYGSRLEHIMGVESDASVYAQRISSVFDNGSNSVSYPNTHLANQLKTVARLISGGCNTKIYLVDLLGFDTHINQAVNNSPTTGLHANLLAQLSGAVKAFQDDLDAIGIDDKVMTVTFSEFGRRPGENGSLGTDHGTLAPMFVFGSHVDGGVTGVNPDLTNLTSIGTLQGQQYDYREVFTTLSQDWLGGTDSMLNSAYLLGFVNDKIPFIDPNEVADPTCYIGTPLPPEGPSESITFDAKLAGNHKVSLEWEVKYANEKEFFDIERSRDGESYEIIATISAATAGTHFYTSFDEEPFDGANYYRLRSVNRDQAETLSKVELIEITSNRPIAMKVFPSPTMSNATLELTTEQTVDAILTIVNEQAGLISSQPVYLQKGVNTINIESENWSGGVYQLVLISNDGKQRDLATLVKV
ncbi:MAG: DUF1501 domain-containing protein [Saprospiraceae bacterium]